MYNLLRVCLILFSFEAYGQLPNEYQVIINESNEVKCFLYDRSNLSRLDSIIILSDKLLTVNGFLNKYDLNDINIKGLVENLPDGIFYKESVDETIKWGISKNNNHLILFHHIDIDSTYYVLMVSDNEIISSLTLESSAENSVSFYNLSVSFYQSNFYFSDNINEILISKNSSISKNSNAILVSEIEPMYPLNFLEKGYNCSEYYESKIIFHNDSIISYLINDYIETDTIYTLNYFKNKTELVKQEILLSNPLRYYKKVINNRGETSISSFKVLNELDYKFDIYTGTIELLIDYENIGLDIDNLEFLCGAEKYIIIPYKNH